MRTLLEQHGHQLSETEMSFLGGTLFGAAADNVNIDRLGWQAGLTVHD
jgi:hypothetical protein